MAGRWRIVLGLFGLLIAGCAGVEVGEIQQGGGTWRKVDLGGADHVGALVVPFEDELLLFGGQPRFECPQGGDCVAPAQVFEGLAVHLGDGSTRRLAPIPTFERGSWTTTSTSIFLLSRCTVEPEDCSGWLLSRYRVADDSWATFAMPKPVDDARGVGSDRGSLITVGEQVHFISRAGGAGFAGDFLWNDATETWERLPEFDDGERVHRFGLDLAGVLTVFSTPMDEGGGPTLTATRYDEATDEFISWSIPDVQACRTASANGITYFFPTLGEGTAPGLAFDATTQTWSKLPAGPDGRAWNCGLVGVLEASSPQVAGQLGWLYLQRTDSWTRLEHPVLERSIRTEQIFVHDGRVIAHGGVEQGDGFLWRDGSIIAGGTWVWEPTEGA